MFTRSPRLLSTSIFALGSLLAGTDSPVKADSSTSKTVALRMRPSAGTLSPSSSRTMSPGTNSLAGTLITAPSRRTCAMGAVNSFNADSDFSARTSWMKPRMPLRKIMAIMVTASVNSPSSPEISVAASNTMIMKSLNWFKNTVSKETFVPSLSWLRPWTFRRSSTDVEERPASELSRADRHSADVSACQFSSTGATPS